MVGEPLLMTGADLAGVRLLSTLDELFTGSGLGGRGWVSVSMKEARALETVVQKAPGSNNTFHPEAPLTRLERNGHCLPEQPEAGDQNSSRAT